VPIHTPKHIKTIIPGLKTSLCQFNNRSLEHITALHLLAVPNKLKYLLRYSGKLHFRYQLLSTLRSSIISKENVLRSSRPLLLQLRPLTTLRSAIVPRDKSTRHALLAFLLVLSLSAMRPAEAQQSNTLYMMHSVPQSNQLNPAVQPDCRLFIGLPGLSTLYLNYSNSSFVYNELASGNRLQLNAVFNRLYNNNLISVEAAAYLLSAGYRKEHNYFTFSVADRSYAHLSFPRDLVGLALFGNAQYTGKELRLGHTRLNAAWFREYSAGWSQEMDQYTTLGMRGKLLFGKVNFHTGRSQVGLGTDFETFDLSMQGEVAVNSSFPVVLDINEAGLIAGAEFEYPGYRAMLMNPRNVGLAADFGMVHHYSDDVTFSASLLDVGMILWTDDLYNLRGTVDFDYTGVSDEADFSLAGYYRDISDSIVEDVIYEISRKRYVSALPAQLFLGSTYRWRKNVALGMVLRSALVNRRIRASFTTSANLHLADHLHATVSWSLLNNSFKNVGLGMAYTGRGVQMFAVSDNAIGFFRPLDTRTINLRFGVNLMFGCPTSYFRSREPKRSMVPCPPGMRLDGRRR
jgi:hypothetical protein